MTLGSRALYALSIFLSSSLLFLMELVAGKRLLPLLGGSAAVWTTCLVFFQCALLLGYFVAHWLVTRGSARSQATAYLVMLALSLIQLIATARVTLHASVHAPVRSVLWLLAVLIGLPFVTLSVTSPLLQAWYARSLHHAMSRGIAAPPHPYRLFSISNLGSLAGLVSFPWLIEERLGLRDQATVLAAGVFVLGVLCAALARSAWTVPLLPLHGEDAPLVMLKAPAEEGLDEEASIESPASFVPEPMWWILLATCGSFLLSATTNYLNHIITAPLLWTLPLVLYLLTFTVAFGSERWHPRVPTAILGAVGVAVAVFLPGSFDSTMPLGAVIVMASVALFGACLFFHSELHRRRPPADRLTAFYLCIAIGGSLGAIMVGVVAPYVLSGDYDLAVGLLFATLLGVAVSWSWGMPVRIASGMLAAFVTVAVTLFANTFGDYALDSVRNFYGTLTVAETSRIHGQFRVFSRALFHGTTDHGEQVFREDVYNRPITYYSSTSGVGLAMTYCCGNAPRRVGVIGLGTGTMAAYGRPGDTIRFYEINPAVEPLARTYFTYLRNSPAKVDVVTGDGRISMTTEPPQNYNVIVVDAFSGDAIPVHLITAEALALYRRHLAPGGIIAFHVSNNFLDLAPVVRQLASAAGLGSVLILNAPDDARLAFAALWVLVSDNQRFLNLPAVRQGSMPIDTIPGLRLWTDDYNTLVPILRFTHPTLKPTAAKASQ